MVHLNFDQSKIYPGFTSNQGIDPADFAALKAQVDATVGPEIQAFLISWSRPFRIARFNYYFTNYSITSASPTAWTQIISSTTVAALVP